MIWYGIVWYGMAWSAMYRASGVGRKSVCLRMYMCVSVCLVAYHASVSIDMHNIEFAKHMLGIEKHLMNLASECGQSFD